MEVQEHSQISARIDVAGIQFHDRRKFLDLAAGATACSALRATASLAAAQTYPSRPVRLIVGFAPGGFTDLTARLIGPWLSDRLGKQFFVENRPGASSNIATAAVARAPPDGYTLLEIADSNAIGATLSKSNLVTSCE